MVHMKNYVQIHCKSIRSICLLFFFPQADTGTVVCVFVNDDGPVMSFLLSYTPYTLQYLERYLPSSVLNTGTQDFHLTWSRKYTLALRVPHMISALFKGVMN